MKKSVYLLIIVMILSGCAAVISKPNKPIVNSRTLEASYDEVWEAIPQVLTSSGEIITIAQKDSGLFSFKKYLEVKEFQKIALAPKNVTFLERPVLDVNVVTTKVNDKHTTVTINSEIKGSFKKDFSFWCASRVDSNGIAESNYLDKIESCLKK